MIYLVLGEQGVGKTKYLVEQANKEKVKGNNNIVFVDTDDSQINTLDHKVRLINAKSKKIIFDKIKGEENDLFSIR